MPPTSFFTTHDGDIILRAGQKPGSTGDFRVHKFILSLASPVFKDMLAFPQPSNQNRNIESPIPTVDIPDSPEVIDAILRFIYPGVEPPKVTQISVLAALFSAADKYNITSIYPVLREPLKAFLPQNSFRVYIIACQFGFLEEAKAAARVSTSRSMVNGTDYHEAVQHISGPNLYRLLQFVQEREHKGVLKVEEFLGCDDLGRNAICDHWDNGKDFYSRLAKEVGDEFVRNPCLELKDLFEVFDRIPDPPLGCEPQPNSANWYYEDGNYYEEFSCPLMPMTIRSHLTRVVWELDSLNHTPLSEAFEKGIGSG